jgi:hypothetical protein
MLVEAKRRLELARQDAPDAHFIEVRCDDVLEACAALPADPVTERLERACPAVVPTRNRRNAPAAQRIWLGEKDLAHLLSGLEALAGEGSHDGPAAEGR